MNWFGVAFRFLKARAVVLIFTVVSLSLGIGLVLTTLALSDATRNSVQEVSARYPLVIGPKVGAVPLVLGTLTSLSGLEGGIEVQVWKDLAGDDRVDRAVPILLGHAVGGHPLVGTSSERFQPRPRYPLAVGRLFDGGASEVVAGSDAARALGISVGDSLPMEHRHGGGQFEEVTLKVVGILQPTGDDGDRTLYCPVEAVFASHAHVGHAHVGHDPAGAVHEGEGGTAAAHSAAEQLSAVLVVPRDRQALLSLQEDYVRRGDVEVAATAQTLRRIADRLSATGDIVHLLALGVSLLSLLSLALGVYVFALHGSRETAVLRLIGARRGQAAIVTAIMGAIVSFAALIGALLVATAFSGIAEDALRSEMGFDATVSILSPGSLGLLAWTAAGLFGIVLLPTLGVYRSAPLEALRSVRARSSRERFGRRLRAAILAILVLAFFQATMREKVATVDIPLDADSRAMFGDLAAWVPPDPVPPSVAERTGMATTLNGFMYVVDSPFEAEEFYLVGQNPRLAHCPFCYRAPTRTERILVRSPGKAREITAGPVRVTGVLRSDPGAADPLVLELQTFEVVTGRQE